MSNYNIPMNLTPEASAGLPRRNGRAEVGYAMAALLVGMSVMAVMLSVAMPTWSQMIRRDKEEELIFRGTQYARAINQYQRKFANASPANLDLLIEQRMLRKKFRDPLSPTKDGEFQMLYLSNQAPGSRGGGFGAVGGAAAGRGAGSGMGPGTSAAPGSVTPGATTTTYSTTPSGGIVGVTSKNTGASIKIYKGKQRYNEWQFVGMESGPAGAGGAGGPAGAVGGRGGPERGRGGREGSTFSPLGSRGGPGGFGSGGGRGGQGGRGGDGGGFPGGGRGPMPSPPR